MEGVGARCARERSAQGALARHPVGVERTESRRIPVSFYRAPSEAAGSRGRVAQAAARRGGGTGGAGRASVKADDTAGRQAAENGAAKMTFGAG